MLAMVYSYALRGIDAVPIRVEVDLASGSFPTLALVGLPDTAVRESRERIVAALRNQGLRFPARRITVNLAPAGLPKGGVGFDLPIAIGLLVASGQAPPEHLTGVVWAGELSLEGQVRPIRGCLSMASAEQARRPQRILVLPQGNGAEAAAAGDLRIAEVSSLRQVVGALFDGPRPRAAHDLRPVSVPDDTVPPRVDLADVRGQLTARRALEVAAAGGHNLLMIGAPGTGKSMLAERLPGILPPLAHDEQLAVTMVHSAAGLHRPGTGLVTRRPFRAPHHSISLAGLIGGGRPAQPGEISLAHRGVLFLDEIPEFSRRALEALRQPLETGTIVHTRANSSVRFPCRAQLVAAMNPCPCGRRLDPRGGCRCSPHAIERYCGRLSGPMVDRIDMHVEMGTVSFNALTNSTPSEGSATVRGRVWEATARQRQRFRGVEGIFANAQMGLRELREHCPLSNEPLGLLRTALRRLALSPRAFYRILRVARTIADLAGSPEIGERQVAEAISYRLLDRGALRR